MAIVRLRKRNQITLPAEVFAAAGLLVGDVMQVSFTDGVITLKPVTAATKRHSILDFVGIGKGTWGASKQEITAALRVERDSWER